MKLNAFYQQINPCRLVPARYCFVLRSKNDAVTPAHSMYVRSNGGGIDNLKEIRRLPIGQIDYSTARANLQIPIACTLSKLQH